MDDSRISRRNGGAEPGQLLRFRHSSSAPDAPAGGVDHAGVARDRSDVELAIDELSSADLFGILWRELADILGTAAAATLLRRAAQRALPRWPELATLRILRERLEYRYSVPSNWKSPASTLPGALSALACEAKLDESVTPLIADPHRFSQIVGNLVANAIKFTPAGGRIEVRLERAGMLARIQVIDSGSGIRPEVLSNVFERFRTADSSSTRAHGGLGVGLALVKDLVELHGGQVRAGSPGELLGATFTVDLPLAGSVARVPVGSERSRRPARRQARKASTPPQTAASDRTLDGIRVLLVDDDEDIGEVLQFVLESQGAVVSLAGSAAEALAALEGSMPHVLISDISMPGETGYDLMRKIVAHKGTSAPPAAALSAYARGQDLREALASGFQRMLTKPIDPAALITAVKELSLANTTTGNSDLAGVFESRQR